MPANALQLLIALFIVHFLLDFSLQPYAWVNDRYRRHAASPGLYVHALAHGCGVFLCFWLVVAAPLLALIMGTVILIAHFLTDLTKSFFPRDSLNAFLLDQLAHWILLLLVWAHYAGYSHLLRFAAPLISAKGLLVILAYLLVLLPTSIVVQLCLKPWLADVKKIEGEGESLAKAGATIGYLERVMVLTLVLVDNYTAIGFVLALKTAFRFKDTEDRRKAEYMMVGTFLSFSLTTGIGIFVSRTLGQL